MATLDKTNGSAAIPYSGLNKMYLLSNTIDTSVAANADVYQCLPIKANTLVMNVLVKTVTPNNAGTSSAAEVGDGGDVDGFIDTVDMKAAAGVTTKGAFLTDEAFTKTGGKVYTAADTVDLVFAVTGTNTAGSHKVMAICVDLN